MDDFLCPNSSLLSPSAFSHNPMRTRGVYHERMDTTESTSQVTLSPSPTTLISDAAAELFIFVDFVVIYSFIGVCGILANIINIIVFVKMGLKDCVNLGLLALAVSDLGFLLSLVWLSIYYYPLWKMADVNFDPLDLKQLTASCFIFYFKRVGAWITAFITFERCICITWPLRVKSLITCKRAKGVIIAIFILMLFTEAPKYFASNLRLVFDTTKNETILKLILTEHYEQIDPVVNGIGVALTLVTYVWVITCTFIMIVSLRSKTKWRLQAAGTHTHGTISLRDSRVVRTMTFLAIIFLVSFLPETILLATMALDSRVSYEGEYNNVFLVMVGVSETLLAINASVNISVYLKTSSRYREVFLQHFCKSCLSRESLPVKSDYSFAVSEPKSRS